jgi:hypothetical protein
VADPDVQVLEQMLEVWHARLGLLEYSSDVLVCILNFPPVRLVMVCRVAWEVECEDSICQFSDRDAATFAMRGRIARRGLRGGPRIADRIFLVSSRIVQRGLKGSCSITDRSFMVGDHRASGLSTLLIVLIRAAKNASRVRMSIPRLVLCYSFSIADLTTELTSLISHPSCRCFHVFLLTIVALLDGLSV